MAKDRSRGQQERSSGSDGPRRYFDESRRPFAILVFLLPLVALYELGSALFLSDPERGVRESVAAYEIVSQFFRQFGVFGLYLPGIALVLVLLCQHLLSKERWRVSWTVPAAMVVESAALTAPVLLIAILLSPVAAAAVSGPATDLAALPGPAKLTIAIGAGLYEELVFRLVLITMIHFIMVDLLGTKDLTGRLVALVLSAAAFAAYHDLGDASGGIAYRRLAFFVVSGLYFGVLFLWRGFGIVVGVHALYDVLVLTQQQQLDPQA